MLMSPVEALTITMFLSRKLLSITSVSMMKALNFTDGGVFSSRHEGILLRIYVNRNSYFRPATYLKGLKKDEQMCLI